MIAQLAGAAWKRLPVGAWGVRQWAVAVLVAALIACLPLALAEADWLRFDGLLWRMTAGGAALGLLLGRLMRRSFAAHGVLIAAGLALIVQTQSQALPPTGAALGEIAALGERAIGEVTAWGANTLAPDDQETVSSDAGKPAPPLVEWQAAGERLRLYGWNLEAGWPPRLKPGDWGSGQILLTSVLGVIVWLAAGHAAWAVMRRQPVWTALVPILAVTAANVYFSETGWGYLLSSTGAGLMLAGAGALDRLERRWPPDALYDWLWHEWWLWAGIVAGVGLSAMTLTVMLTDPGLQQKIDDLVPATRLAQPARPRGQAGADSRGAGIWPRQHLLGAGPELSDQTAMFVQTPGAPPGTFYWRATVYDEYTGRGWRRNSIGRDQGARLPLGPPTISAPPGWITVRQIYRLAFDSPTVYAAGRPIRLTLAAAGIWHDQTGVDLMGVESFTAQRGYEVLSWVPAAAPDQLREASGEVPEWISSTYLELPEDLPERVPALAREITSGAETDYDKALAIQNTLRAYEYSLDLPQPPRDRDVVDYFLFDLKRGYCDYYASSMVALARSVGLPARLAVGYRTGTYDPATRAYHVTQADAHSWVEIYLPYYGWIPFEPTGGVPAVEHGLPETWDESWTDPLLPEEPVWIAPGQRRSLDIPWDAAWPVAAVLGIAALLGGRAALIAALKSYWRRRMTPDELVASLYADLRREALRLGAPLTDSTTPHELVSALMPALSRRSEAAPRWSGDWITRLADTRLRALALIDLYAASRYSAHLPDRAAAHRMLREWPTLRRSLQAFRWIGWLTAPASRPRQDRTGSSLIP